MRRSYVQLHIDGEWKLVPKEEAHRYLPQSDRAHLVIPDIQPYRSTLTGEMITTRSVHRAHLRAHGCVEIGNEKWPERKPVPMDSCVPELRQAVREFQRKRRG